jgi:TRAP transporter TAXI family solute receptor
MLGRLCATNLPIETFVQASFELTRTPTPEPPDLITAPLRFELSRWFAAIGVVCVCTFGFVASAPAQDVKVLRIATGPIDSTEFPFGGLVGNAISNPPGSRECDKGGNCGVPGLIANSLSTEGAWNNLRALLRGDVDLALTQADVLNLAFAGKGDVTNQEKFTRLRVIARLYPETIHLVARPGVKISNIKDLIGKRVAVDSEGGGTRYTARTILNAFGVQASSVQLRVMNMTAAAAALKDNKIDAMFLVSGAPVLALDDLSKTVKFKIIPLAGPQAQKLVQATPYFSLGTIPANTYGDNVETPTIDVGSVLVARDDLDEELGFGIARAIWHERNKTLFENGHPRGKLMDKNLAARGLGVPVHPGAARYYIAQGLMEPPARIAPAEASKPLPAKPQRASPPKPPAVPKQPPLLPPATISPEAPPASGAALR